MTAQAPAPSAADGSSTTVPTTVPTTAQTVPTAAGKGRTWRDAVRRWRWPAAVSVLVLAAVLVGVLLTPRQQAGNLDPDATTPDGTRALAQVLRREGVTVTRAATSQEAQEAAGANRRGTLVVVRPQDIGPAQLRRLAATPADLVLVEPDAPVLDALAPGVEPAGRSRGEVVEPDCDDPDAVAAGGVGTAGLLYRVPQAGQGQARVRLCYPDEPGSGGPDRRASLVVSEADGRRVVVLGSGDVLRNGSLAQDGNAALALRLLGTNESLTWYVPSVEELATGDEAPGLADLLPAWVPWVALQGAIAACVALLWRGRRLGRLVTEPLPVVVRSAETQEGRARLYRSVGARDRAAATLRTAVLRRLASRLDVGAGATPEQVAALVAVATGRDEAAVREVLLGAAPPDDAALVRLADDLDALEAAVAARRATGPPAARGPSGP